MAPGVVSGGAMPLPRRRAIAAQTGLGFRSAEREKGRPGRRRDTSHTSIEHGGLPIALLKCYGKATVFNRYGGEIWLYTSSSTISRTRWSSTGGCGCLREASSQGHHGLPSPRRRAIMVCPRLVAGPRASGVMLFCQLWVSCRPRQDGALIVCMIRLQICGVYARKTVFPGSTLCHCPG